MKAFYRCNQICLALVTGVITLIFNMESVGAAEKIYLDYGILGRSIPVTALEKYASDGFVDNDLDPYLNLLSANAKIEFRALLSTSISSVTPEELATIFSPFVMSQWFNSPIGERGLLQTGEMLKTGAHQNGYQALRAALVLAASDAEGLSLINLLHYWPTEEVRVDLVKALQLIKSLKIDIEATEKLVATMQQQSAAVAATEPALDYGALPFLTNVDSSGVVERHFELTDADRDRSIPIDLYLPDNWETMASLPVMLITHGYGDTRKNPTFAGMARHLAAMGFVVALPEHIGSNHTYQENLAKGLVNESFEAMEFVNRPLDITFLLDSLERQNKTEFAGRLQLERVGIMGHSFGGYTALAASGGRVNIPKLQQLCALDGKMTPERLNIGLLLECRLLELQSSPKIFRSLVDGRLRDDRIGLTIVMSPISKMFGDQGLAQLTLPVVILGGSYDVAAPVVPEQLDAFTQLTTEEKYFYLAEDTSHTVELTRMTMNLLYPHSKITQSLDETSTLLAEMSRTLIIAHSKTHLLGDETYRPYLSAAYVEANSAKPTRVHLVRSFQQD